MPSPPSVDLRRYWCRLVLGSLLLKQRADGVLRAHKNRRNYRKRTAYVAPSEKFIPVFLESTMNKVNHQRSSHPCAPATPKLLAGGLFALGVAGAALSSGRATAATVTPPPSVPSTYSVSGPVATSTAGYTLGLSATQYSISPTTNLYSGGPGNLEGGPGTSGYPNLQGMANLETLALNGTISVGSNGIPGSATGSATYTASITSTSTDTGINTNSGISTTLTNNAILDQIGYVYAPLAGQTYDFNLPGGDTNDDGTEVFLGGNGTTASGTVVAAQNADEALGVSADTAVTFTSAGLYRFEIFNAQTWGGSGLNFTYTADSTTPSAPALTFYSGGIAPTAAPTPTPLALAAVGLIGLGMLGLRRKIRRA